MTGHKAMHWGGLSSRAECSVAVTADLVDGAVWGKERLNGSACYLERWSERP
jgi:hypothetical protein